MNKILKSNIKQDLIIIDEYEFTDIASEFINSEVYMKLANEVHHGISRLKHSFKVAKATYHIAKSFGLDYRSATRAAFLHDFFFNDQMLGNINKMQKYKYHPQIALLNAQKYFYLNEKEIDGILNHMYPLTPNKPKTLESMTLNLVDKGVAISDHFSVAYEYTKKLTKKIQMLIICL